MNEQTQENNNWTALDPSQLTGTGLFSERVNIDAKADAFASAPPVDDGKYVFLLGPSSDPQVPTLQARHYDANGDKPAMNVIRVNTSLTIVQGFEGQDPTRLVGKVKRFDKAFSTFPRTVNGLPTNEVATILQFLGADLSEVIASGQLTNEMLAATLNAALVAGQSQIGGSTVWKAGWTQNKADPKDRGKWLVQGQKNFDLLPGGVAGVGPYNPIYSRNGVEARAKAYLRNEFFSLVKKG